MPEEKLIGLSVSECFLDMANGTILPEDVKKVIARTYCRSQAAWELVMKVYSGYWKAYAETASSLLRQFIEEKRIEQPRLINDMRPNIDLMGRHWVTDESQIVWELHKI